MLQASWQSSRNAVLLTITALTAHLELAWLTMTGLMELLTHAGLL